MQLQVVTNILDTFQLNQNEICALHGNKLRKDTPITSDIFNALDKVQKINNNCKTLIQYGHQTLALNVMEQMTLHYVKNVSVSYLFHLLIVLLQEGALERLYKWTQNHCRNVDNTDLTDIIVQAMARLQEKPVLFK